MDDRELRYKLSEMDMGCFVKYFREFANSKLSREYVNRMLQDYEGYTSASCAAHTDNARNIIRAGRAVDALQLVIRNPNVDYRIKEQAKAFIYADEWPVLSLFSGSGGLDLGFEEAGFRPLLAIDSSSAAIATYERNHPGTATAKMDLSEVEPEFVLDLWDGITGGTRPAGIIGGPPCQGFSKSNAHQSDSDPRRRLLYNYASIIEIFTERYDTDFFVLENVPGLNYTRHKPLLAEFKEMAVAAGFIMPATDSIFLDAGNFGVPQHRKRLVMVGINAKRYPGTELVAPEGHCDPPSVASAIAGLPEPVYCGNRLGPDAIPYHPNHVAMVPKSPKFTDGSLSQGNGKGLSFKVLAWDSPSYTVAYGHNEIHVHPDCHRRLSVYEAMLLQGFPRSYELVGTFTEQVRLVSDAVPPPMAEGVARSIIQTLGY